MAGSSGLDLSKVLELAVDGFSLFQKNFFAGSARKYARAVKAAHSLGQPDCLVLAFLQLQQQSMAQTASVTAHGGHAGQDPVVWCSSVELLVAACTTIQRRFDAGTLLPGTCRPYEEEWHEAHSRRVFKDTTDFLNAV